MLLILLLTGLSTVNIVGFWNSQPNLDEGYGSCYFFWDSGEYAHLESLEQGIVQLGDWHLDGDYLVLDRTDAIRLDGSHVNMGEREMTLRLTAPSCKSGRMLLDGESFYRLGEDPDLEIISLVPTFGMSPGERDAFSTYD